jgi:ribosome-binding factor A
MLIKEEIASILANDMKDPRLSLVTITHVSVSRDMRRANIYFSVLGESEDIDRAGRILKKASGYIKGELGRKLRIKRVPDLDFEYDDSYDKGMRIDRLLDEIKRDE